MVLSMELRCSHVAAEVSVLGIYPGKGTLSAPGGVLCVSLAAVSGLQNETKGSADDAVCACACACVSLRLRKSRCVKLFVCGCGWVGEVGNRRKRGELLHVVHCTSELGTGTMNEI